jgi:type II restriction enzyme
MKLEFDEAQAAYKSPVQNARVWTERWVRDRLFCPNCGAEKISPFETNRPVADFFCGACDEEYELKGQKNKFGMKVLDGASAQCAIACGQATIPIFYC